MRSSSKLDVALAVLNGAVGDYLARTRNGLALEMACMHGGRPITLDADGFRRAHPKATPRIALLVPGLMCTESVWQIPGRASDEAADYGALLARDLGFTPLYVRYNSGLAIADSGAALARMLEAIRSAYPLDIEEILPIGFSMGGLVVRSACHVATAERLGWLSLLRRAIYVGTPHLGAPLERVGRLVASVLYAVDDPYTRLAAELADLRSDGIKDLGDADLRHEDRALRRARISLRDPRHPVPLLASMQHYLVAGTLGADPRLAALFGDALVPVPSATDGSCVDAATMALPPSHVKILTGMPHVTLARSPEVYERIRAWCEERP